MIVKTIRDFLKLEAASGLILMAAAVLALIAANSPVSVYYDALLQTPVVVQIGRLEIAKPLLWSHAKYLILKKILDRKLTE